MGRVAESVVELADETVTAEFSLELVEDLGVSVDVGSAELNQESPVPRPGLSASRSASTASIGRSVTRPL